MGETILPVLESKYSRRRSSCHGVDIDGADRGELEEIQNGLSSGEYPTYTVGHDGVLHSSVD